MDAEIDRTYVSKLERDLQDPSVSVLEKLAKGLGCNIADLFDPVRVTKPVRPLPGGRRKGSKRA